MATAALRNEGCRRAPPSGRRNVIGRRAPMSRPALMRRRDGQGGPAAPGPSRRALAHRPRRRRLWVPAMALAGRRSLRVCGRQHLARHVWRAGMNVSVLTAEASLVIVSAWSTETSFDAAPAWTTGALRPYARRVSWALGPVIRCDGRIATPLMGRGARLGWALSSRGCVVGATQGRPTRLS